MAELPTIQIAIAEDHNIVREGLCSFINESDGMNAFIEAANGKELLEKISTASYQPDICLIDISMPVMDGYNTMLQIRNNWPYIHGIALTAFVEEYPILKMFKNGASGYLPKNVRSDTFKKAIIEVYTNGIYFGEEVVGKFPKISKNNLDEYIQKMFSEKEIEFLSLCCSDLKYAEIGRKMNLSQRTAENYAFKLSERLNIHSRVGLAMYALKSGIGSFASDNPK